MDTRKVAVVLLIVAILFSLGTIIVSTGFDSDDLSGGGVTIEREVITSTDSGTIGIEILEPQGGGN